MLPIKILKLRLARIAKGEGHLSTQDKLMLVSMESPDLSANFFLRLFKVSLPKQWKFQHETDEELLYISQLIQLIENEFIPSYESHARKYAWYEQCLMYKLNFLVPQPTQQQINTYLRQLDRCLDQQPKIDLLHYLQEKYPSAKITHRLDMATSGILMFAKHRDAEVAISKMFQARTVTKNYIALVQGKLEGEGRVDVPLITDWENRPRQMVHFELGKSAKTLYKALEYNAEEDITRVLLTPITGRSHQLRVHMMHIGHPITGDKIYHPEPDLSLLNRMALHASYLAFKQPLSGKEVEIKGNVPF